MSFNRYRLLLAAVLTLGLAACGSKAPRPDAELALADAALQSAVLAGAREHAPIELRSAQQKRAEAEQAVAAEENVRALQLSEEARVDAELARARAEAIKSETSLEQSRDNIEMLRRQVAEGEE